MCNQAGVLNTCHTGEAEGGILITDMMSEQAQMKHRHPLQASLFIQAVAEQLLNGQTYCTGARLESFWSLLILLGQ